MKNIDERVALARGWRKAPYYHWQTAEGQFSGYVQPRAKLGFVWNPSELIAHVWELVEEMEDEGYSWELGNDYGGEGGDKYCLFQLGTMQYLEGGKTIKLAICEAYLKVKGAIV